jgi:ribulose bisphosphate carboxylase small subunit
VGIVGVNKKKHMQPTLASVRLVGVDKKKQKKYPHMQPKLAKVRLVGVDKKKQKKTPS